MENPLWRALVSLLEEGAQFKYDIDQRHPVPDCDSALQTDFKSTGCE